MPGRAGPAGSDCAGAGDGWLGLTRAVLGRRVRAVRRARPDSWGAASGPVD